MNEILKTLMSFLATITTAFLIYIFSKRFDFKKEIEFNKKLEEYNRSLDKRLFLIEEQIRKIITELELDNTIEKYASDLYKFYNYLSNKNKDKKHIEKINFIGLAIINNIITILQHNYLDKAKIEELETLINALKNECVINVFYSDDLDCAVFYGLLDIYKNNIIDIVFDTYNKKEIRAVKEANEFIKNVYCYL